MIAINNLDIQNDSLRDISDREAAQITGGERFELEIPCSLYDRLFDTNISDGNAASTTTCKVGGEILDDGTYLIDSNSASSPAFTNSAFTRRR